MKSDSPSMLAGFVWFGIFVNAGIIYFAIDKRLYDPESYDYPILPLTLAIPLFIWAAFGPIGNGGRRKRTKRNNRRVALPRHQLGVRQAMMTALRRGNAAGITQAAGSILFSIGILLARTAIAIGFAANAVVIYYFYSRIRQHGGDTYPFAIFFGIPIGILFGLRVWLDEWQESRRQAKDETMSRSDGVRCVLRQTSRRPRASRQPYDPFPAAS